MTFWQGLILGAVQGIAEWLPISSEGINTLILLNGVEINNIDGLSTPVMDGDTLVLLSVTHGG